MKVVGISGSLREKSYNTIVLRLILKRFEGLGVEANMLPISTFPLYNPDERIVAKAIVDDANRQIANAHLVIFTLPEYNHSISGPLKNAIDWLSEPYMSSVFKDKPIALIGVAPSPVGSARAIAHMKTIMGSLLARLYNRRDLVVGEIHNKVDEEGQVKDAAFQEMLEVYVRELKDWLRINS